MPLWIVVLTHLIALLVGGAAGMAVMGALQMHARTVFDDNEPWRCE